MSKLTISVLTFIIVLLVSMILASVYCGTSDMALWSELARTAVVITTAIATAFAALFTTLQDL